MEDRNLISQSMNSIACFSKLPYLLGYAASRCRRTFWDKDIGIPASSGSFHIMRMAYLNGDREMPFTFFSAQVIIISETSEASL